MSKVMNLSEVVTKMIEELDLVSVVRCKDCVHRVSCCRNIRSEGRRPDDYCSFGERGEADDES